jgi:hypothetical protein
MMVGKLELHSDMAFGETFEHQYMRGSIDGF